MDLVKVNIPKTWTLIGDNVTEITFQNVSQQPIYVTTTTTNTPPTSEFGVVFELYQGYRGPIPENTNRYVWAKAISKPGAVVVGAYIDDLFHGAIGVIPWEGGTGGGGGGGGSSDTTEATQLLVLGELQNLDTDIGAPTDTAAPADGTGNYSVIPALKRALLNSSTLLSRIPNLINNRIQTNITNKNVVFRDACETYPDTDVWEATIASGDFIVSRGNTAGAGWIEINKSPWNANSETLLSLKQRFGMPIRLTTMTTLTHRNAGEHLFSQEFVSDDASYGGTPVPDPTPVQILNASQSTTTITINFVSAPTEPFRLGQTVSIYGFVDTRLNVNSATVASIISPTSITIVGNDYAFTSTTIGTTLGNAGGGDAYIERVDLLGGARNGVAQIRSNATATNSRYYARAQGGRARPSGTLAASHNTTTGTDVSVAIAGVTPYSESWSVPTENIWLINREGIVAGDRAPDVGQALSARWRMSQVVPNPDRPYILRFRVRSTPSLTRPVAKIVSVSKSGATTATVTTDSPHGLITGQYVGAYGVRDQTNFANLTTGAACTVTGPTTFTVVWGSAVTATSYGGFVMRVQGQQALGGAIAQVAQTVSRTDNILTIVGNTTWAAPAVVGNIVEVAGVRDASTGADLNVDGVYVVRNLATSTLTLEPAYDSSGTALAPLGSNITTTNCGGGLIQRFGARIHGIVTTDYEPLMTELSMKGLADGSEQTSVLVTSMPTVAVTGGVAQDSAAGNPVGIGGRAANVNQAAMSATGDLVHTTHTMIGALVNRPYSIPEADWQSVLTITNTTSTAIQTAAGAGIKRYMTNMTYQNTNATATFFNILRGTTVIMTISAPANMLNPESILLPTPLQTGANEALNIQAATTGASLIINAQGYTAP